MKHRRKKKENFRNCLSLSQLDLANYLGVSLSQVAMWECRQRSLPTTALLKLSFLEIEFEKSKAAKIKGRSVMQLDQEINEHTTKTSAKMLNKVALHRPKAALLERRLKDTIEKQEAQSILLNFIDEQLDNLPENKTNEGDLLWLKVQQDSVSKRLLKINKEIASLSFDIDLLRAVAEVHERHWGKREK